jgi:hypothetical protein
MFKRLGWYLIVRERSFMIGSNQLAAFFPKLIVPQLVKKFPAFYGTLGFVNVFTRARHLALS